MPERGDADAEHAGVGKHRMDRVEARRDRGEQHGRIVLDAAVVGHARFVRDLMERVVHGIAAIVEDAGARGRRADVERDDDVRGLGTGHGRHP